MTSRRDFLKLATHAGLAVTAIGAKQTPTATPRPDAVTPGDDRRYWVEVLQRIARPVLENMGAGRLHNVMPVEASAADRSQYTHLEAFGRLLSGIAPWLASTPAEEGERKLHGDFLRLAQRSLDIATNPQSPAFLNFTTGGQVRVDAAFLAQGLLRGKAVLWDPLETRVKQQIVAALKATRQSGNRVNNNWVMFAALIETALLEFGETVSHDRLEPGIRQMLGWYKGDSMYGDGEWFHFDYYNSFVIHPMLVDSLSVLARHDSRFADAHETVLKRAARYAQIQERLIAPDGTFPAVGRSITYRFGAFHALAQMVLLHGLPKAVKPAQVRCALTAVIRRMIEAPGTFDEKGFLRVGFCGHQPALGENYISTGSLYLCAAALLPLGLPASDPFWNDPPSPWTSQALWSGENLPADHAMSGDTATVTIPDI